MIKRKELKVNKNLFIGFIAIYALRLLANQFMGLMPQDAYYYFYSEHLAMSYFDHPPMVAYMLKFFSLFLGKSVFAVKLTDFIITLVSFAGFYYLASLFLSKHKVSRSAMFYGSTLLLTVISINTTPDVPLVFFWTLSLIVMYKAVFEHKILYWILSGILIGLSFDSKYTAIFLLFGLVLFLLLSKNHRRYLFSKELFLTVLFFLITISPIFFWNMENDWISFKFQSSERASSMDGISLQPKLFLGNLATQMFLLLPTLFVGIMIVLYKWGKKIVRKRRLPDEQTLFLLAFSFPVIAFFFGVSTVYWVKLNWIMPAYITAIILAGRYLSQKALGYQIIVSLVLHILLFIQISFYPFNVTSDDTWFGWEELAEEVDDLSKKYPDNFLFANDGYKTTAVLNFYLDQKIYAGNILGEHALQYSMIDTDLSSLQGKNALFIDSDKRFKTLGKSDKVPEELSRNFKEVVELEPIVIRNSGGKALRKFLVFECLDYQPTAE
jgi:hypothetical protein